jgi:type III restriction enzyme
MEFSIPYDFYGVSHAFKPDFLVRLTTGSTLILEIKGLVSEQDEAKFQAAKRWVSAVNNWGRMGPWQFHACKDPNQLSRELNYVIKTAPLVTT